MSEEEEGSALAFRGIFELATAFRYFKSLIASFQLPPVMTIVSLFARNMVYISKQYRLSITANILADLWFSLSELLLSKVVAVNWSIPDSLIL